MEYRMSKSLRCMYTAAGLVFVGVTVWLWLAGGWNRPLGDPTRTLYRVAAIVILVLGVLSLLRPWRARIRLEDDEKLYYCDGYLAARRFPMGELERVCIRGGKRMVFVFRDGHSVGVEFLFTGQESFLAEMRTRGIQVAGPGAQIHQ